eukprot:CAMPEP_0171082288 /NCGR_PEP_ID=MMETSP0766_2-20121228/17011_1 /TAXON_ID=439317 /ORGANISM="Gambierdiscus australes, Strain CAWD 149" /LENGTH=41 /DNA_ID= /DNA_START= /DNA_END= /DNA_ORIENTATION=
MSVTANDSWHLLMMSTEIAVTAAVIKEVTAKTTPSRHRADA